MAMSIPTGPLVFIASGEPRQAFVYAKKEKTDQRVADEQGQPLSRFGVLGFVLGAPSEATIELADFIAIQSRINESDIIKVTGAKLAFQISGGDFSSIRTRVTGVDRVEVIGSGLELWDSLLKNENLVKTEK